MTHKKNIHLRAIISTGLAAATCALAASASIATGNPEANGQTQIDTFNMQSLSSSDVSTASNEIRDQMNNIVPMGVKPADQGRELLIQNDRNINVVPAPLGLCLAYSKAHEIITISCFPEFSPSGLHVEYSYESEQPLEVFGVVTSGVSTVTIQTSDGKSIPIKVTNDAFAWTAPTPESRVISITSTRSGQTTRVEDLFSNLNNSIG